MFLNNCVEVDSLPKCEMNKLFLWKEAIFFCVCVV